MSYHPCNDCAPSTCHEPICDERFYSLPNMARVKIDGIIPGGKCRTFFTGTQGFLMDDGSGAGQFIAKSPNWLLDFLNPKSGASWPQPASGFPVLMALGGDSEGTPWKLIHAPSSGTWFLQAKDGLFSFWDAGQIPGVNAIFANAGNATAVEVFGFLETAPGTFGARKLIGSGTEDQFLVLRFDESTGRYKITAGALEDDFIRQNIVARTWVGLDMDGDAIADGFAATPNDVTLSNYSLLGYDKSAHRIYRAPGPVAQNSTATDVSVPSSSTYVTVFDFGTVSLTYPNLFVAFNAGWYHAKPYKWGLFVDGTLRKEWDFTRTDHTDDTIDAASISAGVYILSGMTLGNHSIVLKAQSSASGQVMRDGSASILSIAG